VVAVGLIPARGGSKGIGRKNITPVAGKPLLAWTAAAALTSQRLAGAILSTDDEEIAAVGVACGLEVPFLRPAALASDTASSIDVVMHALEWLDHHHRSADVIVLLQPTTPLRIAADIDGALLALASSEDATSVVSVARVPAHFAPDWQLSLDDRNELRLLDDRPLSGIVRQRQLLPMTFYRNGAVYAVRREVLESQRSLYGDRCVGYVMPSERSVNIDTVEDLAEAERLLLGRRS
jgi:CMP-N-acetylneuraminic acid synthetase